MHIVSLRGKHTNFNFMPFAKVVYPETVQEVSLWSARTNASTCNILRFCEDGTLRFNKRNVSFKAALRKIRKQNYRKGTVVHLLNWHVGYSDLLVYI